MRRSAAALAAAVVVVAPAAAGDRELLRATETFLPAVERTAPRALQAETAQPAYDAARDLEEALRRAEPVGRRCQRLLTALRDYASAVRRTTEGVDLPWVVQVFDEAARAVTAHERIAPARAGCTPGPPAPVAARAELETPRDGEAFFGAVRARIPPGAATAAVRVGRRLFSVPVRGGRVAWRVPASVPPGRYDVAVVAGPARRESRGVWLLPGSARSAGEPRSRDRRLDARLEAVLRGFDGYSGIWVHELATGRVAGWNEDARFAAASTVKLALLVATLRRGGARPERSPSAYDLAAAAGWSSNLAANRLLAQLGDPALPQRVLAELGATSSTFTGPYRVGTRVRAAPNPPPVVSSRVTTARDLGRILFLLHRGALGYRDALELLRLDRHAARVALGWLLSWTSPPPGDNAGNLRPALPHTPLAQKNGWFSSVRHTAAIVYGRRGPTIVVLLTHRSAITLRDAQALGRRTVALLGLN